jgi:RNA polymerase-interacting CarD/CdnL/TRCF family regulator
MLDSAKEILISELILAKNWDREETITILDNVLAQEAQN